MRFPPAMAAYAAAALFAFGVAVSVYRIPIQVSDSLDVIERTDTQSVGAAFVEALQSSRTMLRPMRQVQAKVLLKIADALGGRYRLAFRGYHVAAAVMLVLLFCTVARPRSWTDVAALVFALAVLGGLHTFGAMLREAYPINHFLMVALYALATFAIARTRGGVWRDAAAVLLFVVASLTLESGLIVAVVAGAAYVAGLRGISRRGLIAIAVAAAGYVLLRVGYLHMGGSWTDRPTGFGASALSAAEVAARWGAHPWPLYAYTIAMSGVSVLLSQPMYGRWTVVAAARAGAIPPVFVIDMASSLLTTLLIAWYGVRRDASGRRGWRDPLIFVFGAVWVANAAISYAYAKDEIISMAGVFYALAAYAAIRALLESPPRRALAIPLTVLFLVLSSGWALRVAGLHYHLRAAAYTARAEWARRMPSEEGTPRDRALVTTLRYNAILERTRAGALFPAWSLDWFGER